MCCYILFPILCYCMSVTPLLLTPSPYTHIKNNFCLCSPCDTWQLLFIIILLPLHWFTESAAPERRNFEKLRNYTHTQHPFKRKNLNYEYIFVPCWTQNSMQATSSSRLSSILSRETYNNNEVSYRIIYLHMQKYCVSY